MSYSPNNVNVYTAAYSGAFAGMVSSGRYLKNSNMATYANRAAYAGAWAQQFDTLWGSNSLDQLQISAIAEHSNAVWEERTPTPDSPAVGQYIDPTTYSEEITAIVAAINAEETFFAQQGITPPPYPPASTGGVFEAGSATASIQGTDGGNTASGEYTFANGRTSTASGFASIALGDNANAQGDRAVALSKGAAFGNDSFAMGNVNANAKASVGWGGNSDDGAAIVQTRLDTQHARGACASYQGSGNNALAWGTTPGEGAGESVDLTVGTDGAPFTVVPGNATTLEVVVTAAGIISDVPVMQTFRQTFSVIAGFDFGIPVVIVDMSALEQFGSVDASTWTFDVTAGDFPNLVFTFTTGATTALVNVVADAYFVECVSPAHA